LNKVIASSSVRGYKGRTVDAATVTQEVDVRAVVMGSMVQLGENIRINVELIDGENNSTLWGETYTRPRSTLYEMEEYLSKQIADALGIQLTGEEGERLAKRYTGNSQAHEAYLKGRAEQARFTVDGHQKAIRHFEEAIEKDPNYASAYTAQAECYRNLVQPLSAISTGEGMPKAEELAMKALELDNTLGEAHAVLGHFNQYYYWDWGRAEEEYKLAIELDPSSFEAPYGYAFLLSAMGRHEEAITLSRRAQQLDPLNLRTRTAVAFQFVFPRQYDEALEQLLMALEMDPNYQITYSYLSDVYVSMGRYQEAASSWQKWQILGGASEEEVAGLSEAAVSGKQAYWQWQLDYWTVRAKEKYVPPTRFARNYALLGEKDEAFEWLEKAYQEHVADLIFLKVSQWADPLRSDPRFQDLLRRMNLEP